ncbi:MAG: ATP-binding protein [Acidobacteriota bacterium]|nr:ATP-binding protein [Acidobacteriota bacterium]
MHFNIRRKYTLFILLLIIFIVGVFFVISYQQNRHISASYMDAGSGLMSQALLQSMEQRGVVISQLLAQNLVNPLYNSDQNAVRSLVEGYRAYRNVIGIYVYDGDANLIHDGTEDVERYGSPVNSRELALKALSDRKPVMETLKDAIEIYCPVVLDQTVLGGVKIELSLSEIRDRIAKIQTQLLERIQSERREAYGRLIWGMLLVLLAGVILSYSLATRISIPIRTMARYAADIGRGNYGNRMEYRGKDEIGDLVRAFNSMQQNLTQSTVSIKELENQVDLRTRELSLLNDALKTHKEQLETKVAERTAELLETNRCLTQEIEERKSIQEKLVRAKKMEAIGTLAASVAHDLNNILTGMVGIPDVMLMNLPADSPLREDLLMIRKSGLRAAAVVQDLLNLARKNAVQNSPLDLHAVLQDYLSSPEHCDVLKNCPGVTVETVVPPQKYRIMGSRIHLTKVLMNLVSNAAESMRNGGRIVLSLENLFVDPSEGPHKDYNKGPYIRLRIQDSGDGIPAENLQRIFEPFYTTKAMGRSGSGLGLTVVRETLKDHNGYIEVQSTVGKGTVFDLYFPATEAEVPQKAPEATPEHYRGNGESILIVDDLESQRVLLQRIVEKFGYRAQSLPSGEDAVAYLKSHSADLLVLDMMMAPGIDGLDTYRQISQFKPGQKAIIVSGYSDAQKREELQSLGVVSFIRKPYTAKQIGRAIRMELDR